MPYITKISTGIRSASGLKDNNIRSASGKYSILANNAANTITVNGFNFSTTALVAKIANTATSAGTDITSTTGGTEITITASETNTATITNTSIEKSGYLELFSNTIRALNNINNNNSYGSATTSSGVQLTITNASVSDYANAYNREPDYYTTKNVQLTDDRYLLMFDMHTAQTPKASNEWKDLKNAYYPVMVMNGDNPVFGYMNGSGGPNTAVGTERGTGAGNYRSSHAMPQRAEFNGTSGAEVYTEYLIKASAWDAMGMAVDEGGRYYNVSSYNRDGSAMSLIYDRYGELYDDGNGWGAGTGYNAYTGNWSYEDYNNAITLDSMNYGGEVLLGRYMYPKLVTKGNSISGAANVYMAYYDDGTGEIAFRDFQVSNSTDNAWKKVGDSIRFNSYENGQYFYNTNNSLDGKYVRINNNYYLLDYYGSAGSNYYYTVIDYTGTQRFDSAIYMPTRLALSGTDNNGRTYGQSINFLENKNYGSDVAEGRLQAVAKGSRYYDMAVTSDDHVVILYYDEDASRLKLIYSTNEVDGSSPTTNVAWTPSSVTFPDYVGTYCSMTLDSSNGIHIAAFDASEADLKYFYLPSYSSPTLTSLTIDASGSVGHWTGIAICNDEDNTELYGKPVISYYNSTETGSRESIKMAYPKAAIGSIGAGVDSDGYTTGNWEYMTVPAITPPQGGDSKFQKVCLGFDTKGIPVLGYSAANLEFGKQKPEATD